MIGQHRLPPLDFGLSPETGFTRAHWESVADAMVASAWEWSSPRGARIDLPGRASASGVRSDGLEGFARTFLAAAFRVAGAHGEDPHDWMGRYARGLVAGTRTPGVEDAESWPWIRDYDVFGQPMVESASIALGLRLTRPWLWDRLSLEEQDGVIVWLRGALVSVPAPNNWYLFPFTVAGFLESVGCGDGLTSRVQERARRLLDDWYVGQGWYADGDGGSFDHYNGWALHLYPVLDEFMAARERHHDRHVAPSRWSARLREHLSGFSHLFASDGAPVYFGRSMTYRFATSAAVGLGAATGATPLPPGASRRILSGNLRYFLDRGAFDGRGLLGMGWHREHAATLQSYSGPASPYWASKAFVALLAPADHPLWSQIEEPAPVEISDHVVALEAPGLLVQSTRDDGIVRLHNHGSDHLREVNGEAGSVTDPLYSRCAYSSHSGPTSGRNQPDNALTVDWRGVRGERTRIRALGAGTEDGLGWAASWHRPIFPGRAASCPGLKVTSVVVVHGTAEVRIHVIEGAPEGASVQSSGWATPVENDAGVTSTLLPLVGWTDTGDVRAPEGTAFGTSARVPRLEAPLVSDQRQVFVSLASLAGADVSAETTELRARVEELSVDGKQVSFRWRGQETIVTVGLDPVRVTAHRGGAL
ncbi:DUF2264 domain-containing protein [Nesterenkonia sp. CF4.4]|uniref:DUF2264 domain-containing protein n=1 Tax=Nesterenkonia sp. CF4.4 TaxID=3373079 RepID=UPI003EE80680